MADITKVPSRASGILKQGEYGYPIGHLGHLTEAQEKSLVEFKDLCTSKGLYKPPSSEQPSSHDDATMLRFLRARRFVPQDAFQQFKETENWRGVNELDSLYRNIDVANYDEARRLYPQWTGRRDKRGMPVFVFEVKSLDSTTMAAYAKSTISTSVANSTVSKKEKKKKTTDDATTPPRLLRLFALYEFLTRFCLDLCSVLRDRPYLHTPISQSNNIVDISGVGLKQFWNLRGHMQDASVLATAHYPETLDRIFVVGAPAFFPTVWSWIKRWFDPITVSKIFILSDHNVFQTLSTFIEPESIPKKYGGKLDFKFGQLPTIDPAYSDCLIWKDGKASQGQRLPEGPLIWLKRDQEMDLMAVGSVGGKERREVLATLYLDRLPTQEPSLDALPPGTPVLVNVPQTPTTPNLDDTSSSVGAGFGTGVPVAGDPVQKSTEVATKAPATSASAAITTESSLPSTAPLAGPAPLSAIATNLPASSAVEKEELANGKL